MGWESFGMVIFELGSLLQGQMRLPKLRSGRVVTLSPPTSEARVRFPARSQVGKLVVACHWSAVYSTEP